MKKFSFLVGVSLGLLASDAFAGGPLLTLSDGTPGRWSRTQTAGVCGTQRVRAGGTVEYRTDGGVLGPLTNAQAKTLVDTIFAAYSNIATSDITFVNGGQILNPNGCAPVDVTAANSGPFLSSPGESVIIYGEAGFPNCSGGTLGFAGPRDFNNNAEMIEGLVVLCGGTINGLGVVPFQGVFTHEFAHFVGLDHSQVNGHIASVEDESFNGVPLSVTQAQSFDANNAARGLYDVFAPFGETVFPFLFGGGGNGSDLTPFFSSGEWVQTLELDDKIAVSTLHPTSDFSSSFLPALQSTGSGFGAVSGRILAKDGVTPVNCANVVVRRVNSACLWPPAAAVKAFTGAIPSSGGVPAAPPAKADTDCIATASSAISGYMDFTGDLSAAQQNGRYKILGLPAGDYIMYVENIVPQALGGSSIGGSDCEPHTPLETEEFWNLGETGATSEGATTRSTFRIENGFVTQNVDLIINGAGGTTTPLPAPVEPNGAGGNDPPVVTISSPGNGASVNVTTPDFVFSGTVSDPTVTTVELIADGTSFGDIDVVSGSFTIDLTFCGAGAPAACATTPESAALTVIATNLDGSGQDSQTVNFTPQGSGGEPPVVTITGPANAATTTVANSSFVLAGTVSDASITQVFVSASGGFNQNFNIQNGAFNISLAFCGQDDAQCNGTIQTETITVRATNSGGAGQDAITITFDPNGGGGTDTTAPLVTLSQPSTVDSVSTQEKLFALAGLVDDPTISQVKIFAGEKLLGSLAVVDGVFSTDVEFGRKVDPPARVTLIVRATDEAGNNGEDQIIVSLVDGSGDPTGAIDTTDVKIGRKTGRCSVDPGSEGSPWLLLFGAMALILLPRRRQTPR